MNSWIISAIDSGRFASVCMGSDLGARKDFARVCRLWLFCLDKLRRLRALF